MNKNDDISKITLKELKEKIEMGNENLLWEAIEYIAGEHAKIIIPSIKRILNLLGIDFPFKKPSKMPF